MCPACGRRSRRVHSHYTRSPADLPVTERRVRLHLLVRRFRCLNPCCERRTFAEAFPNLVLPHAQRTTRLAKVQAEVGIATSGESGARLLAKLQMPTGADTILRLIRHTPLPEHPTPRVLGVDDWSFRRGKTFGTILVDLEKHCVVDLLPDRSAETFTAWLKQHPGVDIISRDRSGEYARGASEGAPKAVQVADRWHLLKNLGDTLQAWAERHRNHLVEPEVTSEAKTDPAEPSHSFVTSDASAQRHRGNSYERGLLLKLEHRDQRLVLYQQAKHLHEQGFSVRASAIKLGIGRSTVTRLLNQAGGRKQRAGRLEPFVPYLQERVEAGMTNKMQLYRELLTLGFIGSCSSVYSYFAALNAGLEAALPLTSGAPDRWKRKTYCPSRAKRLFTQDPAEHELHDKARLDALFTHLTEARPCFELAQAFLGLFRHRDALSAEQFKGWLQRALNCEVLELRRFAKGLLPDGAAVEAALTLPWSSGQTEGQVTKLKLIKRQLYGRANFDLLRRRVLLA